MLLFREYGQIRTVSLIYRSSKKKWESMSICFAILRSKGSQHICSHSNGWENKFKHLSALVAVQPIVLTGHTFECKRGFNFLVHFENLNFLHAGHFLAHSQKFEMLQKIIQPCVMAQIMF